MNVNINQRNSIHTIDAQLQEFWEYESVTATPLKKNLPDVKFNSQRYEVPLPWKSDKDILSGNCHLSKGRLVSLLQ